MSERAQRDLILKHLISCQPLTDLEALDLFGCRRLAARIWELKQPQHGAHPIKTTMIEVGERKRVAQYTYNFSQGEQHAEDARAGEPELVPQPSA